jgi:hypothetical protein
MINIRPEVASCISGIFFSGKTMWKTGDSRNHHELWDGLVVVSAFGSLVMVFFFIPDVYWKKSRAPVEGRRRMYAFHSARASRDAVCIRKP